MTYRVSELAHLAGVSSDAIRFYEKEGLLPAPPRTPSGYRQYDDSTPHRLQFIKGAQAMGLKLAEIKELLEIQDRGACPCGHTRSVIERRISEIDTELARLSSMRTELTAMANLDCPASDQSEFWACEVTFVKRGGGGPGGASASATREEV